MEHQSIVLKNREAWQMLARHGHRLASQATPEELADPLNKVDSVGWLGGDIGGWKVLCLAAGGGRHGPLYAAAGAEVTVVDFSSAMLDLDREMSGRSGLRYRLVETSMDDLSMFENGQFDLVIHPVSTCYIAAIGRTFSEVSRVIKPKGLYISQHKQPSSLQVDIEPHRGRYYFNQPYYSFDPLPPDNTRNLIREPGAYEYIHRWENIIGEMCRAGFLIEDLIEPNHADAAAPVGSFGHRSNFVAPYVRIKARRRESQSVSTQKRLIV